MLLKQADLVITIGCDPIEYEARNWNKNRQGAVINLDSVALELTQDYQPDMTLQGNLADTIDELTNLFQDSYVLKPDTQAQLAQIKQEFDRQDTPPQRAHQNTVHPLEIVQELQKQVNDSMIVTVDVGSHYIWMARHFRSYESRHLLFSNGMQTLGVALPWAIAAALLYPDKKIVSVAGDGVFLFSGQELETAVRLQANIVQLVCVDGYYDMVRFQEQTKYGHTAGVDFGPVDFVKYAHSFGAQGLRVDQQHSLPQVLTQAFALSGPVIVEIPVDYSQNQQLNQELLDNPFN